MEESSLGMNGKEGLEVHRLLDHRKKQAFDPHVTNKNSRNINLQWLRTESGFVGRSKLDPEILGQNLTLTRSHAQKKIALSAYGRNTCRWRDSARPSTLLQQ